jgi:Rps23 Pro-64 3,4-dihydroxylase Tpa1-like proline 4-hydroxylase
MSSASVNFEQDTSREAIRKEELNVNGVAFLLHNVLSASECKQLIDLSEKRGFDSLEHLYEKSHRNNTRVFLNDENIASILSQRVKDYFPGNFGAHTLDGFNGIPRFGRYHPGEYFRRHQDQYFISSDRSSRSRLTFVLYLNEGFTGGEFRFLDDNNNPTLTIPPKPGMALVFQHDLFHESATLVDGTKYLLADDVMFSNTDMSPSPGYHDF